jgi:hypothetical protein
MNYHLFRSVLSEKRYNLTKYFRYIMKLFLSLMVNVGTLWHFDKSCLSGKPQAENFEIIVETVKIQNKNKTGFHEMEPNSSKDRVMNDGIIFRFKENL